MRAETRTVGRRIGLDGKALVQQAFVVDILQQEPQRLDIAIVVGDIRVVHVHPVADAVGQVGPFLRIFHHFAPAGRIVFRHRDLRTDVGLGDAEFLLNAQLHRKSVGIPTGLALHMVAGLRLVAADGVLDGAGHHMVDARHAVGGGRSLEENEIGRTLTHFQNLPERILFFPLFTDLIARSHEVQLLVLGESHIDERLLHFEFAKIR